MTGERMNEQAAGEDLDRIAMEFGLRRRRGDTDEVLRARLVRRMSEPIQMRPQRRRGEPWRRVSDVGLCRCGRVVRMRRAPWQSVHQYEPHDCTARRGRAIGLRPVEKSDGEDWLDLRIEERRKAAELLGRRDYFRTMRNNRLTVDIHTLE